MEVEKKKRYVIKQQSDMTGSFLLTDDESTV